MTLRVEYYTQRNQYGEKMERRVLLLLTLFLYYLSYSIITLIIIISKTIITINVIMSKNYYYTTMI